MRWVILSQLVLQRFVQVVHTVVHFVSLQVRCKLCYEEWLVKQYQEWMCEGKLLQGPYLLGKVKPSRKDVPVYAKAGVVNSPC